MPFKQMHCLRYRVYPKRISQTRVHSSRMRTARALLYPREVSARRGVNVITSDAVMKSRMTFPGKLLRNEGLDVIRHRHN